MSEYTPTTETVRERFADGFPRAGYGQALADFDRWLAAHDAEVRAESWDEGFADRHGLPEHRTFLGDRFARNPYRVPVKQEGAETDG